MKDLIDKLNDDYEIETTESEKHRMKLQEKTYETLLSFLNTFVSQLSSQTGLKAIVEQEITSRLQDKEERISTTALIQLLKILKDTDVAGASSVLNVLKENTKVVIENNNLPPQGNRNYDLTLKEVEEIKDLVDTLKSIVYTESSADELEKKETDSTE